MVNTGSPKALFMLFVVYANLPGHGFNGLGVVLRELVSVLNSILLQWGVGWGVLLGEL